VVLPWAGGALLLLAAVFAAHSWWATRGWVQAQATVTENVESFAPGGGILYRPRLRFRTREGQIVLVLSRRGSDDVEFEAGKAVPVIYRAADPQSATIATVWRIYTVAIWLAFLGTVSFDVGLVLRRTRTADSGPRPGA
jgi:hypothetical protein